MELLDLEESDDVEAAAWIGQRLLPFERYAVGSVIPTGFEAYAWIDHEREGLLPREVAQALIEILIDHPNTDHLLWLALWDGQGYLHPSGAAELRTFRPAGLDAPGPVPAPAAVWRHPAGRPGGRPRLRHPHREYILFRGRPDQVPGWMDGPNLWWPDDRAWCVASEIDLPFTFVGGSKELTEAVLGAGLGARRCWVDDTWN